MKKGGIFNQALVYVYHATQALIRQKMSLPIIMHSFKFSKLKVYLLLLLITTLTFSFVKHLD